MIHPEVERLDHDAIVALQRRRLKELAERLDGSTTGCITSMPQA